MSRWLLLFTAGELLWVVIVSIMIVLQRRSAAATIAWLLAMTFLPIVGLIIYRVIGPLRLRRKKLRRTAAKRVVDEALRGLAALGGDQVEHLQLAMVGIGLGEAPPLRADAVDVFLDGNATYDAILAAIAAARDHVHLEYYIWEPDTIGARLRDLLIERARAGVTVRMLVDAAGSHKLSRAFLRPLRDAGVQIAWFNPIRLRGLRRRPRPDFRSHRKIVVCDGRVGFTGGMNIADAHSAALSAQYWRDTHVRITGAAVWPMQRVFIEDWYFAAGELIAISVALFPPDAGAGEHLVQIVSSGPDTGAVAIQKTYFTAINQATRRLWLTTPYFVPDDALLTALVTAGLRGVDVRVLVPRRGDSRLVDLAARSYFPELIEANVRIYEYQPRFIHAKTLVGDDDLAIIGTANFDNRSFRLNFEIVAVVSGAAANRTLAEAYAVDLRDSRELVRADLAAESFVTRLWHASARLMSPLL